MDEVGPVPPGAVAPGFGTTICVPSVSGAARLRDVRSAPFRAPPARFTASITRSPDANSYTPGFRTQPATSTMIATGLGVGESNDVPSAETTGDAAAAAAISTGFGSDVRTTAPPEPA